MLYSEFLKHTNSKASEYNYKVYDKLNELYMENDKLTKDIIYKVGKQLVDNSDSEEIKKLKNNA